MSNQRNLVSQPGGYTPPTLQQTQASLDYLEKIIASRQKLGREWRHIVREYRAQHDLPPPEQECLQVGRELSTVKEGTLRLPQQIRDHFAALGYMARFSPDTPSQMRIRAIINAGHSTFLSSCFGRHADLPDMAQFSCHGINRSTYGVLHSLVEPYVTNGYRSEFGPDLRLKSPSHNGIAGQPSMPKEHTAACAQIGVAVDRFSGNSLPFIPPDPEIALDTPELRTGRLARAVDTHGRIDLSIRQMADNLRSSATRIVRQTAVIDRRTPEHLVEFFDLAVNSDAPLIIQMARRMTATATNLACGRVLLETPQKPQR